MSISFAGVFGIAFGGNQSVGEKEEWPDMGFGIVIGVLTSILFATGNVINRTVKEIDVSVVLFYHTLIGTSGAFVAVLTYCLCTGTPFLTNSLDGWLLIGLGGLCDFVVVGSNIIAFQSDSSGFISLLGYMQVVYAFLLDIFVFKSTISVVQLASALVICVTTLTVAVYKARTQTK